MADTSASTTYRYFETFARSIGTHEFSDALRLRTTLVRAWQTFMDTYPVVLMPTSTDLTFVDDLHLVGETEYQHILQAQAPMLALPALGLPGLSLCTGNHNGIPVGVQIVA